jgi:hypothetical protein
MWRSAWHSTIPCASDGSLEGQSLTTLKKCIQMPLGRKQYGRNA